MPRRDFARANEGPAGVVEGLRRRLRLRRRTLILPCIADHQTCGAGLLHDGAGRARSSPPTPGVGESRGGDRQLPISPWPVRCRQPPTLPADETDTSQSSSGIRCAGVSTDGRRIAGRSAICRGVSIAEVVAVAAPFSTTGSRILRFCRGSAPGRLSRMAAVEQAADGTNIRGTRWHPCRGGGRPCATPALACGAGIALEIDDGRAAESRRAHGGLAAAIPAKGFSAHGRRQGGTPCSWVRALTCPHPFRCRHVTRSYCVGAQLARLIGAGAEVISRSGDSSAASHYQTWRDGAAIRPICGLYLRLPRFPASSVSVAGSSSSSTFPPALSGSRLFA